MEITLNGQSTQIADCLTVRQLIEQLGLAAAICAVEINGKVVPRGEHEQTSLSQGDAVEVVTLVGGG